jgi:prepilin-type N-terminal cleavage/methylation domain-containing protein
MDTNTTQQSGFSAVELLITLFIAALFVLAGSQLYTYVYASGVEANQRARASTVGYEYMRSKPPAPASPCTPNTETFPTVTVSGLKNVTITVAVTCPYPPVATPTDKINKPLENVSKVTSTVTYGTDNPQKQVKHEIYVKP